MAARPEAEHTGTEGLSARDRQVLAFERQWWKHVGAKEQAIRDVFGLSAARYYQLLNVVIDSPDAVRDDPMLVKSLQRAREARTSQRATRTFTSSSAGDTGAPTRSNESIE